MTGCTCCATSGAAAVLDTVTFVLCHVRSDMRVSQRPVVLLVLQLIQPVHASTLTVSMGLAGLASEAGNALEALPHTTLC